jgi:hypothetical protein
MTPLRLTLVEDREPDLLNARELMARVGLKASRFYALERQGFWKFLETKRPLGHRRFARVLVEKYLAGESAVQLRRMA